MVVGLWEGHPISVYPQAHFFKCEKHFQIFHLESLLLSHFKECVLKSVVEIRLCTGSGRRTTFPKISENSYGFSPPPVVTTHPLEKNWGSLNSRVSTGRIEMNWSLMKFGRIHLQFSFCFGVVKQNNSSTEWKFTWDLFHPWVNLTQHP